MKRRQFITLLGGAAAWPLAARAQRQERMRRIGVLLNVAADDPTGQTRLLTFAQALAQAGWTDGRNIRIVGRGRRRAHSQIRGGIGGPRPRLDPGFGRDDPRTIARGEPYRADGVHGCRRSGRRRLCR